MISGSLILPGLILFSLFVTTLVCTGLFVKLSPKLGLVKEPTSRCAHIQPTPRGGGIAFVITCLCSIGLLYGNELMTRGSITAICSGGLIIAAIGFWDDLNQLSIKTRLSLQLLIIISSVSVLSPLPAVELWGFRLEASWLMGAIAVLGMMWWLNLFNFMDGIDGLAASEAISVLVMASILIYFQTSTSVADYSTEQALMILLAVSLLGFLGANWAPAKIFMGDVGSTFLGFVMGMLALMTLTAGSLNLWVWLILPGVFWIDATVTLMRRMLRGDRWYQGHQSHAYQRVSRLLEGSADQNNLRHAAHRKVTSSILAINVCWLFPWAACAIIWPAWGILFVGAAWMPLVLLAAYCGAGKPGEIEWHTDVEVKTIPFDASQVEEIIPEEIIIKCDAA
ncbi:glycosyltransferase family 4 protein [uncultured Gimesia sp.]|uniref:MraY family glycosyltransferase n=1 Tax=uncultured Gimesia sp. TaxID=1678688 RepID=UPI00262903E2|nr:glycosyltransferase family 4 protein [uncultured Gimesia sp.]